MLCSDWVIEQCRALDKSVDAEMLTAFLNVVDSAQDVEDYVLSYFRDTQRTRDFVQTYLRRRTDYRRGLETAAAAASSKQTAVRARVTCSDHVRSGHVGTSSCHVSRCNETTDSTVANFAE
jgi:hypothetical protein